MPAQKHISLDRLREYGWSLWDPTGKADLEGPRDEYDPYLIGLVSRLRSGAPDSAAVRYLMTAESESLGLSLADDSRPRARALVAAIKTYLSDFPDGPFEIR